jgi:hypothetical protein
VTVFRYGVVVLFGMSILEEDQVVRGLHDRTVRPVKVREDETPPSRSLPTRTSRSCRGARSCSRQLHQNAWS